MESKIIFGKMVDYYRKQNNLTMEEFGEKIGKTKSSISRWISGERYPKIEEIEQIADYFGVDIETLIFGANKDRKHDILPIYEKLEPPRQEKVYTYAEEQLHEQESTIEENKICYLPTIDNSAAAANPTELAYGDITIEDQQYVDVPNGTDFAVPIHGDSMEPLIENGSYVFVKTQDTIENGEIALVEIDNDGVTCKKVYLNPDQGTITLHSLNSEYDDREIDPDRVRIIGKVLI